MADPEKARMGAGQGEGRRPRDFKCSSDTGPRTPGILGFILPIID